MMTRPDQYRTYIAHCNGHWSVSFGCSVAEDDNDEDEMIKAKLLAFG